MKTHGMPFRADMAAALRNGKVSEVKKCKYCGYPIPGSLNDACLVCLIL